MGICSKCGLRTASQDCECLQAQLGEARAELHRADETVGLLEAGNERLERRLDGWAIAARQSMWITAGLRKALDEQGGKRPDGLWHILGCPARLWPPKKCAPRCQLARAALESEEGE